MTILTISSSSTFVDICQKRGEICTSVANEYRQFSYHPKSQIFHSKSTTYLLISLFFQVYKNKNICIPDISQFKHWKCRIGWSLVSPLPFAFPIYWGNIYSPGQSQPPREWHWLVYSKIKKLIYQKRGLFHTKTFLELSKVFCYQEG